MKIGLFFGTFNPVHIGHMVIAGYMAEFTDLDQVWFVLSPQNPLKEKSSLLKDAHRLALLKRAVKESGKIKVSDAEFELPRPSYTINTLAHLKKKYPQHTFVLIMGSDNLVTLNKWKDYQEIIKRHNIYVYPRRTPYKGVFASHRKIKFIEAPLMDFSSTFIRKSLKQKKDVRYMLPTAVREEIWKSHFYEK